LYRVIGALPYCLIPVITKIKFNRMGIHDVPQDLLLR
jgi:hypothetical protein